MRRTSRNLAIIVVLLGVVAIVFGGVFIAQGVSKNAQLREAMRVEHITLGIAVGGVEKGEVIDNAKEAQTAGDAVREHRHKIAPTYGDLLGGKKFDPTNPNQLTYAQALNLENYLYLAVMGFGLVQSVIASGVFMIVTGIALGATGLALLGLARTS